jgi:oligopeptide/dipeptide ABC transporter ATP-binding protein
LSLHCKTLLDIRGLKTCFFTDVGTVKAVDGINLNILENETLGLVGESGSGKSVTALSIMRLVPNPGKILDGKILFKGENLLEKSAEEMRKIRGGRITMIFQDPENSLNPVFSVGFQIGESIRLHQKTKDVEGKIVEILEKVKIAEAATRQHNYPHQLSGGMRQRVAIAIALSCHPDLLIADEPTTNLDVTIQAQVLEVMKELKNEFQSSILLITHDLGVIAEMCDRVAVMYAGKVREFSDVETIFDKPRDPYTMALLESIPRLDIEQEKLPVIPGTVPELINPPPGCRFQPRCRYARNICRELEPVPVEIEPGHIVSCLRAEEID